MHDMEWLRIGILATHALSIAIIFAYCINDHP